MRVSRLVTAALMMALGCGHGIAAWADDNCNVKLALTLTPDIPDPSDPGFLGEIVGTPAYQLTWISSSDGQIIVRLTGPGPWEQCEVAIQRLSRDTHITFLKILDNNS